jgi:hypothetical protein
VFTSPAAEGWLACAVLALFVIAFGLAIAHRGLRVALTLSDPHRFVEGIRDPTGTITYGDGRPPTAGSVGLAGPVLVRVAGDSAGDYRHGPVTLVSEVVPGTRYEVYERAMQQAQGNVRAALAIVGCLAAVASLYSCATMQTSIFMH